MHPKGIVNDEGASVWATADPGPTTPRILTRWISYLIDVSSQAIPTARHFSRRTRESAPANLVHNSDV